MPAYRPNQSAREVDVELRRSLSELETAQRNAVLWFADVVKRRLFQELGCSTIHQYAAERLGFSPARTSQFLELARAKEREGGTPPAGELFGGEHPAVAVMATEGPVDVRLRFTPEQHARYEALLQAATKGGHAHSREETLLAALEALVAGSGSDVVRPAPDFPRGKCASESRPAPRYHVTVHQCPDCGKAEVVTDRGNRSVALPELQAILCDARVQRPGERNAAAIPPARRRDVLARDGHRCRGRGCRGTRFLDVHHVVPRDHGGTNDPENLITLCAPCHPLIHRGKALELRPVEGC